MSDDNLPDVLPGHWDQKAGANMGREYAGMTRGELCGGHRSDMATAFDVAMLTRNDLNFESVLAAAKDRIRWLSAQLAVANADKVILVAAAHHAAVSIHHPACKAKGEYSAFPEQYCSCQVQKARAALAKVKP